MWLIRDNPWICPLPQASSKELPKRFDLKCYVVIQLDWKLIIIEDRCVHLDLLDIKFYNLMCLWSPCRMVAQQVLEC